MAFATLFATALARASRVRLSASRCLAALALVFGFFLCAPASAWATPQCNVSFTVQENSSPAPTYILNNTDLANCDPAFLADPTNPDSGFSPTVQTPALGGLYVPSAGGNYTTQSTATDDRIDYTPATNFYGTETFQICGAPGVTNCGTVTVTVTPLPITLSPTSLSGATVASAYSATVTATGGSNSFTYSIASGALPAGLSLNASTGVISGTPTAGGSFNFTVKAADSRTSTATQAYSLTVAAPTVTVTTASLTSGQVGSSYSQSLAASGGTAPRTFAVTSGALPGGLTLSSAGVLSGTPTASGTFTFSITATDSSTGSGPYSSAPKSFSLTIAPPPFSISTASLSSATVGSGYSQTIAVSGGTAPYSFAVTAGSLPAGLTLSSVGVLSGTPTAGGSFSFTVTATDATSATAPKSYTLTVNAPTITISPATLTSGLVGSSYSQTLSASGGTAGYTFAVTTGSLPGGLTLSSGGVLSGTPAASGTFTFKVTATDSSTGTGPYSSAAQSYSLTISAPLTISTSSLSGATVGSSYSQTIAASGGTTPYSFAVTAGSLPAGLSLSSAGVLSGTPTAGGTFNFTVKATDAASATATQAYTLTVGAPTVTLTPATLASGQVGSSYSQTLSASGGTAGYTYAVTAGALPAGLTLSSAGVLSGAPTAGGSFNFTVTATDSSTGGGPYAGSRAYSLAISAPTITISPTSLTSGVAGTSYSQTLTASGGTAGYAFAVTAGALPSGLTLSSAGVLSGTPAVSGSFNFTVTATDSSTGAGPYTGSRAYTLSLTAPPITLSPTSLPAATVATSYSQSVSASGGTGSFSFAVTAGSLPAGVTLSSAGVLTGAPTAGGTFNFTITATDSSSVTGSQAYSLTVNAPTIALSPTSLTSGVFGSSYSQSITASGGTAGYTYAVTAGALPSGVTLASNGTLSGTPAASGTFNFTVTATDSSTGTGPYTGSRAYSLAIAPPTITLSPASLVAATVGASYSQSVSASGGTAPYSFAVTAGSLPAGMTLSSGGVLSGAPTAGGTFNFTITATDSSSGGGPFTASKAYSLTVNAPTITLSPTSLASGAVGASYSQSITASGGTAGYTYAVTANALPTGVTLSSAGVLSGVPTAGGTFNFTVTATDSSTGGGPYTGSRAYSLTIGGPTLAISPASLPTATVGSSYSQSMSGSGGTAPYSFAVTAGSLPAGMTLSSGGVLSGAPTAGGTFNFTIAATDSSTGSGPYTTSKPFSLTVSAPTVALSPASLSSGTVGASYNQSVSASGGISPYSYAVTAGSLPAGVSLASNGSLTGTPTASGTFNFTITATDSSTGTGPYTASRPYNLTIGGPTLALSPTSLSTPMVGVGYSQTLSGSGGTAPYSFAVTSGSLPAGLTLSSSGVLSGTPTAGGPFSFTVTETDASTGVGAPFTTSRAYAGTVGAPTVTVSPTSLAAGTSGSSYSQTITASGGTAGYSFAVTAGALPPGLSLSRSGSLTGTPTAGGTYNFSVTATDSSTGAGPYSSAPQPYVLTISSATITVSPASLPAPTAGAAYNQTITASGGVGPRTFAVASGSLPPGLSLSSSGVLTGKPTAGGTYSFTVRATDSSTGSGPYSGTQAYSLTVGSASIQVAPASLPAGAYGSAYSQTLTALGGTAPYGYALKAGTLPSGLTLSSSGVLSGTPMQSGTFPITVGATDSSSGTGPFAGQAAYSLVINAPPAPTTTDKSVTIAFGSGATPIDLSGSLSGYASSVSIVAAPSHGSASASGETVTYTPAAGYYGPDSFIYKATGPGGDSTASTVHINIPTPAPGAVADTASTLANQAVTIPVTANDSGPISSIAITTGPAHGTAVVSGTSVVYTPAANYFGADSFAYKDTGAGGVSAPATVSVTVQALPAPTVTAQTAAVVAGHPVLIHVTNGATGSPFTAVAVSTAPTQGTAVVSNLDILYTPPANFSGQATFSYTVSNPFGTSQPGTVTVTVNPAPTPQTLNVDTQASQTTTVDLTQGASGGPFTGATIVSVSPSNAGTATLGSTSAVSARAVPGGAGGSAPARAAAGGPLTMTFTPAKDFVGKAVVTFTLSNAYATSAPSTVTFNVSRPDPTKDARVTGLISAQNEAVRQMAQAQLDNFDRRLEDLHRPDGGSSRLGISFNFGDYGRPDYLTDDPDVRRRLGFQDGGLAGTVSDAAANMNDPTRALRRSNLDATDGDQAGGPGGGKGAGFQLPNGLAVWAAGSVDLGQRKAQAGEDKLKFTTAGVSFGVDAPVSDTLIMGAGVGYGETDDDIGNDGVTRLSGQNYVAALYASWEAAPHLFLDGVAGGGRLHFDSRRLTVASTTVSGSRDGQEGFGSLIATYEFGAPGRLHVAPYGRMDVASAELGSYSETGDPVLGLTFQRQSVQLLTGNLGLRGDYTFHFRWGDFAPRLRAEYRHDFEGAGSAVFSYTSLLSQTFSSPALPIDHDVLDLGIGAEWRTRDGLRFSFDYEGSAASKQEDDHRLQVKAVLPWK